MPKYLRSDYFHYTPEVRRVRHEMGCEVFDAMYRKLYAFLITLQIGQWFTVSKLCRNNPANHDIVVLMCDIYHHMDFNMRLEYDPSLDRITILPTQDGRTEGPYRPPDVYSSIVRNPEAWGVNPSDI